MESLLLLLIVTLILLLFIRKYSLGKLPADDESIELPETVGEMNQRISNKKARKIQ